jgi:putative membrane protein
MSSRSGVVRLFIAAAVAVCLSFMVSALSAQSSGGSGSGAGQTGKGSGSGSAGGADQRFAIKAAQGGKAEVELGQLATQKAQDPSVKQFGQRMVDDHTKANDQLKSVAQSKGITLPTDLNAKDKALKTKLESANGAQFDREYMSAMVKDHKEDVAEFQKEANSGKDPDIKNFASQTLPILQDHLKMAQESAAKVGGGKSKGSSASGSGASQ